MALRRWKYVVALLAVALLGWSAVKLRDQRRQNEILRGDPELILSQPALRQLALARGHTVFEAHCASCHGAAGKGDAAGVPDLTNGQHLYGEGHVAEIEFIARHGIRSGDPRGWHLASMPAYASLHPYPTEPLPSLNPTQIEQLTQYVLSLGNPGPNADADAARAGGVLFRNGAGCYDCHGRNAEGDTAIGAPSLVAHAWIYGHGSHDDIYRTLSVGRAGVSPAFGHVLNAAELRDVAVYVASLQPQPQPQLQPIRQADAR